MKEMSDGTGVVFDLQEDHVDRFLELFQHLKATDSRIDFRIEKCSVLPEFIESYGRQSDWRKKDGIDYGGYKGKGMYSR